MRRVVAKTDCEYTRPQSMKAREYSIICEVTLWLNK